MCPEVMYTLYATSSKKQTVDVIMFTHFEEGNILTETRSDAESCDESDNESIMMSEHYMEISILVMSQIMILYLRRC